MITGDPINDEIQWLLQELKQVDNDLEAVNTYYGFIERGNTVSGRYDAIDEENEISWNLRNYLEKQMEILNDARVNILFELECLDESYLEKLNL
ncbi:MAG: hypothetical protein CMO46_00315 [Verrucomicrobiales bacterium]|nr:hypothetical protein [Verrucomicrobiales bacterium]|tara:strand:+ start:602 stop:883 length:282 start_codon:yes stop_codon:yes gene_type:complete